jgi:hypothetical protein
MWVVEHTFLRIGQPHGPQEFHGLISGCATPYFSMNPNGFNELVPNSKAGVQRTKRVLWNPSDLGTHKISTFLGTKRGQLVALIQYTPATNATGRAIENAHNRSRGGGLSTAGLTKNGQALAAAQS